MEFRVLGKLQVVRDGQSVDLGAFRQRALLALLLTSPNAVFSSDQILDRLWGDDGGADKQNALWVYVSGLRKALEPDREKRSDGSVLLTRSPGYLIQTGPDDIDSVRFERLVAEGRALADTDPAAASLVLGEALALWRGHAFEDFMYESFAQTDIVRLEELRLEAVEARIDADLKRGMSRQLVSELETLVRQHPLQEHLTGQLMLALYRSGRQADALRAHQLLKSRLGEELGIEPSAQLRRLHDQIVTGDESLDGPRHTMPDGAQPGLAVRGYELRDRLEQRGAGVVYRAFQPAVGREVAIKVIPPELANKPDFIRRFQADAQSVARLEHPHIVPLYDYWREPDAAYLVMRLMKGGTLADVLEQRGLNAAQVVTMVDQLGSALQTARRAGLVHRDIRPANILIDDEGNAYLSDFGIAVDRDEVMATSDIHSLGVVVAQALTGLTGEVAQIRGALATPVRRVVDRATDVDPAKRYANVGAFVTELHQALGVTAGTGATTGSDVDLDTDLDNPYKGLRSFDVADAADFHGRERVVERLISRLGQAGTRGRFIAVVGPSGSGKSSVVKAGLLPAIRQGAVPSSDSWFTIEMTPAPHPFEELEAALLGVAVNPPASLLEQLAGEHGLQRALRRVLPNDGSQLLLVIDQFEELFTQVDARTVDRFLAALVSAVTDEHSRIRVVATLRADFYDRPLRHRGLGELLREGTEVITPMTPSELERAVVGPAAPMGITFEPALVAELVHSVVDRPGALPLLQYTLTELFEHRQGRRITDAAYREIGGVSGALVRRAEGLLAALGDEAHDIARQVFLRLVTLGEGAQDTRRRVLESELDQLAVDRSTLRSVLDTFGRHRLFSFDRDPVTRSPTVEISHEALLTEWTRLRDWIDAARHDVRNQRRLADSMNEWLAADRKHEYLLRGGRLDQLHGWASTTSLPLSAPEQAFLDASVAERDLAAEAERELQHRAVDAERTSRKRVHQLVGVGLATVLVAALAVFGTVQWRSAENARSTAEADRASAEEARSDAENARTTAEAQREDLNHLSYSQDLVIASTEALSRGDPELALLYAVQGVREYLLGSVGDYFAATDGVQWMNFGGIDAVHWALQDLGVRYDVNRNTPVAIRPGPNGLTGVYVLAPSVLVKFAEAVVDRSLTDAECRAVYIVEKACPETLSEIPIDAVAIRSTYGSRVQSLQAMAGTTVTIEDSALQSDPGLLPRLEAFTEITGIRVALIQGGPDVPNLSAGQVDRPDVTFADGRAVAVADRPEVRLLLEHLTAA